MRLILKRVLKRFERCSTFFALNRAIAAVVPPHIALSLEVRPKKPSQFAFGEHKIASPNSVSLPLDIMGAILLYSPAGARSKTSA